MRLPVLVVVLVVVGSSFAEAQALTPVQLQALRSELLTDPAGLGYAAHLPPNPVEWNALAVMLNTRRAGIVIRRDDVTPLEVLEAIDLRDFIATPTNVVNVPLAQSWLESITQYDRVRLFNDDDSPSIVKRNLDRILEDTDGSQTRLNAVGRRTGSRAEQLFGRNVSVRDVDVEAAILYTQNP